MDKNFPILAIETSGEICSTTVMIDEKHSTEMNINGKQVHSEKLFEMIDIVIKSSGAELKKINHIAISIGPGSFTGLRIGLSAVKGIASGLNLPIIPVPTFDALALKLSNFINENEKFGVVKSAGINDYYFSSYYINNKSLHKNEEIRLINKEQLEVIRPELKLLFGDKDGNPLIKRISGPFASDIANWSYLFGKDLLTFDYDYLEPYYLKEFIVKVKK